jgi:hypothetical protein
MRAMSLQSALAPGARRRSLGALAVLCAAVGAGAGTYAASAGGESSSSHAISTDSPTAFRSAVIARMHTEHLDYHWVACVATPHRFHGVRVVRCNVDFGEPHIVAYCSVLRGGRLLTSEDDPAIPCGHDDAGFTAPVVKYG